MVLREEIKRIGAEVVGIRAGLQRGLLRETQQEVRKIVPRAGYRLRAPGCILRRREAGKHKTAFRTSCRAETLQDAAVVSAETPVVFSAIPRNCFRDGIGLVKFAAGGRVAPPPPPGGTDSREPPVKPNVPKPPHPPPPPSRHAHYLPINVRFPTPL